MARTWPGDLDLAGRPRRGRGRAARRHRARSTGAGAGRPARPLAPGSSLTGRRLDALFDAQLASRHLDLAARWLRAQGDGFYTIGSAGHEANARSPRRCDRPIRRCCTTARAGSTWPGPSRCPATTASRDVLLGLLASSDEPIAGGRHKVFGHADLAVIPQTSTIASHLPRAVGVGVRHRPGRPARLPSCAGRTTRSPCAASATPRSTTRRRRARSTPPPGPPTRARRCRCCSSARTTAWASACRRRTAGSQASLAGGPGCATSRRRHRPGRRVRRDRGARRLRARRAPAGGPAPAHRALRGHAGTDVEAAYRTPPACAPTSPATRCWPRPRVLVEAGVATPDALVDAVPRRRRRGARRRRGVLRRPQLADGAAEVIGAAGAAPARRRGRRRRRGAAATRRGRRSRAAARGRGPLTLAESINRALGELLADDRVLVFGEDVGVKGGVYGVTRGLQRGRRRPGLRHPARRADDPRPGPRRRRCAGCCRSPRSSTSPTCTTPRTSSAARRRPCVLLQRAVPQPMVVRVAGSATRRGSAATSTTTTRSPCCATCPAWSSRRRPPGRRARPMLRTCAAAAVATARSACSSSRSRSTTPATSTSRATSGWLAPYAAPDRGRTSTCRSARRPRSRRRRRARRHVRQRAVPVAARRRPAGRRGHRLPGAGPALAGAAAGRRHRRHAARPVGCWSSTRPAAPGGVGEAVVAVLVEQRASPARSGGSPPRTRSSRWATPPARARLRGRHRRRDPRMVIRCGSESGLRTAGSPVGQFQNDRTPSTSSAWWASPRTRPSLRPRRRRCEQLVRQPAHPARRPVVRGESRHLAEDALGRPVYRGRGTHPDAVAQRGDGRVDVVGRRGVINPTSPASAEVSNGSPVRKAAASRVPLARRRIGTEMIAAATPIRTSVRAKPTSLAWMTAQIARCHQSDPARPHRTLDRGDRRHVGVHQSRGRQCVDDRALSRSPPWRVP